MWPPKGENPAICSAPAGTPFNSRTVSSWGSLPGNPSSWMLVQKEYPYFGFWAWHLGFWVLSLGLRHFGFETFLFLYTQKSCKIPLSALSKRLGKLRLLAKIPAESGRPGFSVAKAGIICDSKTEKYSTTQWLVQHFRLEDQLGFFAVQSCTDPEYARVSEFDKCYWRMRTREASSLGGSCKPLQDIKAMTSEHEI